MRIIILLFSGLLLCGCASLNLGFLKDKTLATEESKNKLFQDLKSRELKIGATLGSIRSTYGEPESISFHGEKTLIIYRRPSYEDSAYLWFDDDRHLSSWSN